MKIFTILFSISLSVLLGSQLSHAQVVSTQEWVKGYSTSNNWDYGYSVAFDNSRNVYVTGATYVGGAADILTIKYNENGTEQWTKIYGGSANGSDEGFRILVDGLGSIYVTGHSAVTGTGSSDFTTIKYNSNGDQLLVRNYNGPGNGDDAAQAIAIDASNNVYITGYSFGNGSGYDFATLKYSPTGSLQWSRRYNGTANGDDFATSIEVDNSGNVYVTGRSAGVGTGSTDYVTIKYNSVGDSLWVKRFNGTANSGDGARSIDLDPLGNVYVTGNSAGVGTGSYDYTTIKYNSVGDSLWVKRYNGTGNGEDIPNSMRVDNSGNVFITGYSVGSGTGNDYVTIKYDTNGDSLWVQRYNVGNDIAEILTIDSLSNVYITGFSSGDYATIKYNSSGNLEWLQRYNQYSNDHGYGIAVDNRRNVYVTGFVQNGSFPGDLRAIRYSQQTTIKTLLEGFYEPVSNQMVRDTVRIYLRSTNPPYAIVDYAIADSAKYYLDASGTGFYRLHNAPYGQYYIQIKHRNSIETWSPAIYPFQTMTYDFTTAASQAYGNNQAQVDASPVSFAIYSGDVNQDGIVDLVDMSITDNAAFLGLGGYIQPDVNGDFFVDLSDLAIVDNNGNNIVQVVRP